MRRRLIDNTLTCISALCVFQIIRDFFQDIFCLDDANPWINVIIILMEFLFFLMILSNFYYKKSMLVDAFDLLKTMSQNNKLHSLREVVMVVNDQYRKSKDKYKINNAEFQYILIRNEKDYSYDVIYKISLNLKKMFLRNDNKMLKFYAILDINGCMLTNNIPINVLFKTEYNIPDIEFTTFPESVTISKVDHIEQFSSLYEISIQIPQKIIKRFKMNQIQCDISYTVKNNFSLKNDKGISDYNFFIYPNNYGERMGQCTVKVFVPKDEKYSIVCYKFFIRNSVEKIFDFSMNEEEIFKNISYTTFSGSFRPQKNAAYFVNLSKF